MSPIRRVSCLIIIMAALTDVAQTDKDEVQAKHEAEGFSFDLSRDPYHFHDYRNHSCKRPCRKDSTPMTCRYYFLAEHFMILSSACYGCPGNQADCFLPQCVPGNGLSRSILTVNRMLPGPTIDVCEGDTIVVLLDNRMELGEGTSIHWHGVRQKGSPHMDGTNLITQCPIHTRSQMEYRFQASDPGTHFWHSHSSIQRSDGLFGGLIVRTPPNLDPHRHLYDYDLPEHYIILMDWTKKSGGEVLVESSHAGIETQPISILVNGLGSTKDGPVMPYPVFQVKAGMRYRFRLAYNGFVNCPIFITVDEHPLLIIATDGHDIEPLKVDAFMIFSGERYDFVLQAKHKVKDNFWIRFKGHGRCNSGVFQAAILRYSGARDSEPERKATYDNTQEAKCERILNGFSGISSNTSFQVVDLQSLDDEVDDNDVLKKKPDKQFYLSMAVSRLADERIQIPPKPHKSTQKPPPFRPINHQLNYISSTLPPSPPLTQYEDIPQHMFCNNDSMTDDCSQVMCHCVHKLDVDFGDIVEIVMVSFTNTLAHPMHLHGHSFRVVAMKKFDHDLTVKEIKDLDDKGHIHRRMSHAPYKDTVPVSPQSVVIVRFRANNPGFWFFHCHLELHSELGMGLILQEGKLTDMPKPPKGFPTCGSWRQENKEKVFTAGGQLVTENTEPQNTLNVVVGCVGGITVACCILLVVLLRLRQQHRNMLYTRVTNNCNEGYSSFS